MTLRPLGTQILIKFLRPADPKAGEFYTGGLNLGLPKAVVLAQGSGRNRLGDLVPFDTSVGDIVYVSNQITGTEIKQDGEVYGVVTEDSLLGLVQDDSS